MFRDRAEGGGRSGDRLGGEESKSARTWVSGGRWGGSGKDWGWDGVGGLGRVDSDDVSEG